MAEDAHKRHGGGDFAAFFGGFEEGVKRAQFRNHQRFVGGAATLWQIAAKFLARIAHVFQFRRAFREGDEWQFLQIFVGHWNREAVAEIAHVVDVHFFLLVGRVLRLARAAHAVAFDGMRENDGRTINRFGGCFERRVDFERIVAAAIERPDVVIVPVGDQFFQLRRIE